MKNLTLSFFTGKHFSKIQIIKESENLFFSVPFTEYNLEVDYFFNVTIASILYIIEASLLFLKTKI